MSLFAMFSVHASPAEAEAEVRERYAKLIEYRRAIEASAYDETLKLCGAFRRGAAGDWRAWARVVTAGLDQPISLLGGHKAEYVTANEIRSWQFEGWFRSVRAIYLTHAPGFTKAATECSGGNPRGVVRLRRAVYAVDFAGSLVTEVVLAAGISHGFAALKNATRPLWGPVADVVRRVPVNPSFVRAGGWTLAAVGGVALVVHLDDLRLSAARAKHFLETLDDAQAKLGRTRRILLMSDAVKRFDDGIESGDLSEFEAWARAHVTNEDRRMAQADLEDFRRGYREGDGTDDDYVIVLKTIVPALERLNLGS